MEAEEMRQQFEKEETYEKVQDYKGAMTHRERFFAIMNFQKFDRMIDTEFGYWNNTLKRWHREGLPEKIHNNGMADAFFGFDAWSKGIPVRSSLMPTFPQEIVEQNERHTVKYDQRRIKCKVFTDGTDTIPHYIDFPIKDSESYLPFKERFLPKLQERIPQDIAKIAQKVKNRDYILQLHAGSTAGWIRDLMGFEGFSIAIYMQPELIDEILSDLSELFYSVAKAITEHMTVDLIAWWEDIAFKTGPIVPPDFFYEKCGPVYKRTMDVYAEHACRFGYVDCDGDNRLLVPTWLDHGVNIIFPLEVNAGVHPEALRKRYENVRMMGGFDKTVLLQGHDAIKKELLRMKTLSNDGGFIPHVDHRVQADVSLRDYLYYLETKRDIFELPNKIGNSPALDLNDKEKQSFKEMTGVEI